MMIKLDRKFKDEMEKLVRDPGFKSAEDLISLALSLGIFFDKKGDPHGDKFETYDTVDLEIWPAVRMILHIREGEMAEGRIRSLTEEYLSGGMSMIANRTREKNRLDALESLMDIIPP